MYRKIVVSMTFKALSWHHSPCLRESSKYFLNTQEETARLNGAAIVQNLVTEKAEKLSFTNGQSDVTIDAL